MSDLNRPEMGSLGKISWQDGLEETVLTPWVFPECVVCFSGLPVQPGSLACSLRADQQDDGKIILDTETEGKESMLLLLLSRLVVSNSVTP